MSRRADGAVACRDVTAVDLCYTGEALLGSLDSLL